MSHFFIGLCYEQASQPSAVSCKMLFSLSVWAFNFFSFLGGSSRVLFWWYYLKVFSWCVQSISISVFQFGFLLALAVSCSCIPIFTSDFLSPVNCQDSLQTVIYKRLCVANICLCYSPLFTSVQ